MKKFLISITILFSVLIVGCIFWWVNGTSAQNKRDTSTKTFVVAKGEGSKQIAFALKDAGLIQDPIVFYLLSRIGGFEGKMQAGSFELSPSQTPWDILQTMTKGTTDVWITIPEGLRASEIAEKLQQNISTYSPSWNTALQQQEGYLFPDTYLFPKDGTIDQVIAIMRNNFDAKYKEASQGATVSYSQKDAVILASLVQREGRSDSDMKYIASVLENRLHIGMALQVDSTVQYIVGNTFNWWPTPSSSDLSIASDYNTYKNPGLPPTPIANPGLTALQAVLHPATTNYLYYFTDKKGVTHFSKTLDEQNASIAKYGL